MTGVPTTEMAENQISQAVRVSVSLASAALSERGFGRAAIVGQHSRFSERFRLYTSLSGMLADGFLTSDAEYREAAALLGQQASSGRSVSDFLIVRQNTPVAQVTRLVTTFGAGSTYTVTVSRKGREDAVIGPVAANTDAPGTAADIRSAIAAAITGGLDDTLASAGGTGAEIDLTAATAGIPFSVTIAVTGTGTLTQSTTTANVGIAEDLTETVADGAEWYATVSTSRSRREIVEAAVWTETQSKIFLAETNDTAVLTGVYSASSPFADVASELKARTLHRTALQYHAASSESMSAAWAGWALTYSPGTLTWWGKSLSGITPSSLTASQRAVLLGTEESPFSGKNVNAYIPWNTTLSRTLRGMMASGRYIDQQRSIDWLQNRIQTEVGNYFLAQLKVPLTQTGIDTLVSIVNTELERAVDAGVLAASPAPLASGPRVTEISAANITARRLDPPVTATAKLADAAHGLGVEVSVS